MVTGQSNQAVQGSTWSESGSRPETDPQCADSRLRYCAHDTTAPLNAALALVSLPTSSSGAGASVRRRHSELLASIDNLFSALTPPTQTETGAASCRGPADRRSSVEIALRGTGAHFDRS
ncbi:hypothetical protein GGS26DRAFT_589344 [Hypomontagnella submonticulosa]|nr:hypothetical protein GGS26DRAFT_589344 [Hypomontagnella submonticulosa]